MNKKLLSKIAIVSGVLLFVVLLANIGVNFWLKKNLPNFIKNNSDYSVTYKSLDVDISTGNILSTGLVVATKNPDNQNIIGVVGKIDSVKISRLGIWDALMHKKINSSNLYLMNPNLNVTLAKPIDDKTGKKRNPMLFKNLKIDKGNITLFRHTKQKFLSVNNLDLDVSNLRMTEKHVEDKLPVVFDQYSIKGTDFYFQPDNVYSLKAKDIKTENGQMSIHDFELNPLITYSQFVRSYPNKPNLFQFSTSEMNFKDVVLKDNKVSLSHVNFKNPDIKIFTTTAKQKKADKSFKYEVNLEDVLMENAKVLIQKPNGTKLFSANNLKMDIHKFLMDKKTASGRIPFSYEKFNIEGKEIHYITEKQSLNIASGSFNPKSAELKKISFKPNHQKSVDGISDLEISRIGAKFENWEFIDNKLKLTVNDVLVDGLKGKITSAKAKPKQRKPISGIEFPLLVKNINVKNANLEYLDLEHPLIFKNLNANFKNIEMTAQTSKNKIPFKTGDYKITTTDFNYKINRFYRMTAGLLQLNKNSVKVTNFNVNPLVSRAQFIIMIPAEKDLYDLKIKELNAAGNWDLVSDKKFINASNVVLSGMDANIFRSKIPKDDLSRKPMYSELLRSIKFPVLVNSFDIKNSVLVYEEDTKKSDGPGKMTFGNFNMNIKNLNSNKTSGKPTQIPISIDCRFMNVSPMKVRWNINPANMNDAFTIEGIISDLPASSINAFVEPYMKIRTTGFIKDLLFKFHGDKNKLDGSLNMKHQNLKVSILKETGEKNKLLSTIVNLVVRSNSGKYPESVIVDDVEREPTKSFFNLFWKGIEEGLKKTLIGEKVEQQEVDAKKTVETTKKTVSEIKSDFQNTKDILPVKKQENAEEKKEKKGLRLKDLFRKKEKSED